MSRGGSWSGVLTSVWTCLRRILFPRPLIRKFILLLPTFVVFFILLSCNIRYVVKPPIYYNTWPSWTTGHLCKPKTNAVFLKLHKCASSTVQNVFMRYGDSRNLTFALPRKDNYLGHPVPFSPSFVPDPVKYNVTYNLLVHHSRLNYEGMRSLMPPDTVYVTVLRDPVDLFESMYSYNDLFGLYKLSIERIGYLNHKSAILKRRGAGKKIGINQMLFDLGFNDTYFFNLTAVKHYIKFLDGVFDLVLISERMDESLLLLRDLMCWEDNDVVVFKVNARDSKYKTDLSAKVRSKLRHLLAADQLLYNFFADQLEQRIKKYGKERMSRDLLSLRNRTDKWYSACVESEGILGRALRKPTWTNYKVKAFMPKNPTNSTCEALTTPELDYTERLRKKQSFYLLDAQETSKNAPRRRLDETKRGRKRRVGI